MAWTNYYRYEPYGNCFIILGADNDILIGDRLPSTEEEARQYVRCANIAFNHAVELMQKAVEKSVQTCFSEGSLKEL